MVYFHSSISLCKPVDQPSVMAGSASSADAASSSRPSNGTQQNRRPNPIQDDECELSVWTVPELVFNIAAIYSFGLLFKEFFGYVIIISDPIQSAVKEEVSRSPSMYMFIALSISFAALAVWGVLACTSGKCENPKCLGLRSAAEFDIQLESEDTVKDSPIEEIKEGLFELPRVPHRELESELKKIAPRNGRAVLVLRARCGCSVGRLEVPGPRKTRKGKKVAMDT